MHVPLSACSIIWPWTLTSDSTLMYNYTPKIEQFFFSSAVSLNSVGKSLRDRVDCCTINMSVLHRRHTDKVCGNTNENVRSLAASTWPWLEHLMYVQRKHCRESFHAGESSATTGFTCTTSPDCSSRRHDGLHSLLGTDVNTRYPRFPRN